MPAYVARRAQNLLNADGQAVHGARVLLLGVTYKANIADQRESPATPLARQLAALGAEVSFHDPYVQEWSVPRTDDIEGATAAADLVILVQHHREYDADHLAGIAKRFFDTRGVTRGTEAHRL
jgi:UDP-N-acetyl-D-glucosamine dehydrogenase